MKTGFLSLCPSDSDGWTQIQEVSPTAKNVYQAGLTSRTMAKKTKTNSHCSESQKETEGRTSSIKHRRNKRKRPPAQSPVDKQDDDFPHPKGQHGTSCHSTNTKSSPSHLASLSSSDVNIAEDMSKKTPTASFLEDNKNCARYAIQWLESRNKAIPTSLSSPGTPLIDIDQVLRALPGLRERERRALVRHVEKCIKNESSGDNGSDRNTSANMGNADKLMAESDDEYSNSKDKSIQYPKIEGGSWPETVEFSNNYRWDEEVPDIIKNKYTSTNSKLRAFRPSKKVYIKKITDPNHPAFGECGLFCALPEGLPPGAWILDYVGKVTLGEKQDKSSDYVSDFGEKSELACDANTFGNEARFLNDFRNTGSFPNVEFNTRRDRFGELRQGVFVKLKKDAKIANSKVGQEFDGIKQHEELLVSYGKSYWRSRVGNLTDFVWRLPGQPPVANRLSAVGIDTGICAKNSGDAA